MNSIAWDRISKERYNEETREMDLKNNTVLLVCIKDIMNTKIFTVYIVCNFNESFMSYYGNDEEKALRMCREIISDSIKENL